VCCSVLQCAAVCCSVLQCVAVCCSVLQCVAVCCSVLQCVAAHEYMSHATRMDESRLTYECEMPHTYLRQTICVHLWGAYNE